MTSSDFDIYQNDSGYVAVTNDVRRTILTALAKKERQLPELVKITKKAKPTLSSVHMKELLAQQLVEEITHPTDKRKKIYRLVGRRIGSSSLPVDQLRSAVKHYVSLSPLASRIPLTLTLEAIAAAPAHVSHAALRQQARRAGTLSQGLFQPTHARDVVTALATFLEREGVGRPLRLDLEGGTLELELPAALPAELGDARLVEVVAGLIEGLVQGRLDGDVKTTPTTGRRFVLALPDAPRTET